MSINLEQFSVMQKASKASFFEQKKLIKQVMSGQTVCCNICKAPLKLYTPEDEGNAGIRCIKGCTDILLDFV
ncbi:hypothetical protein AADZ84_01880 [Colwelliaceae bacterium MEBiC 14330]